MPVSPLPPPPVLDPESIHVFTDGSLCKGGQFGGWGVYMMWREHRNSFCGHAYNTGIFEMELEAIRQAILVLTKTNGRRTFVYCDSLAVVNRLQKCRSDYLKSKRIRVAGRNPVQDAIILEIVKTTPANTVFKWVKGHSGVQGNTEADRLATSGRQMGKDKWEATQGAEDAADNNAVWARSVFRERHRGAG